MLLLNHLDLLAFVLEKMLELVDLPAEVCNVRQQRRRSQDREDRKVAEDAVGISPRVEKLQGGPAREEAVLVA